MPSKTLPSKHPSIERPPDRPRISPVAILLVLLGLALLGSALWGAEPKTLSAAPDFGGLLITPKRIVFATGQRSAEVHLMNSGLRETTYRVEFIDTRMDPTGRLIETDASPTSLSSMVRFAPRQVTLAPSERQTVRLLLRKPADLEAGEYRSHLRLRAIPRAVDTPAPEALEGEPTGFEIRLVALPAISIPVLARHGPMAATLDLSDLVLETGNEGPRLTMQLLRQGERSVYGDLEVVFHPTAGGEIPLAHAKGLAVYPEIRSLPATLRLVLPVGTGLSSGRLRATFRSRPEADGGGDALEATRHLELP